MPDKLRDTMYQPRAKPKIDQTGVISAGEVARVFVCAQSGCTFVQ